MFANFSCPSAAAPTRLQVAATSILRHSIRPKFGGRPAIGRSPNFNSPTATTPQCLAIIYRSFLVPRMTAITPASRRTRGMILPFTRLKDASQAEEISFRVLGKCTNNSNVNRTRSYAFLPPRACRSANFTIVNESMNSVADTSLEAPASFWVNLKMNMTSTGMSGSPS